MTLANLDKYTQFQFQFTDIY